MKFSETVVKVRIFMSVILQRLWVEGLGCGFAVLRSLLGIKIH